MARKFFYICAGMLMLALSYHLGASTAVAQAPLGVECVSFGTYEANAVVNHRLYYAGSTLHDYGPLPNSMLAVACGAQGVVLENGDVYRNNGPGSWEFMGHFPFPGPVNAKMQSWGQVKALYHPTPGTTATPGADNR